MWKSLSHEEQLLWNYHASTCWNVFFWAGKKSFFMF
jgi:hypothetical protein